MEILYPRCARLDVHKETVSVCVLTPGPRAKPNKEIRQFGTTTAELRALRDWLCQCGMTHAAMESTGVYWKPVFNIPDCAWIASRLRHGLLQASFVPDLGVRQLRDLCRMRTTLVRESVQVGNRLRKVLEDANLKLDSVASNALGVSGRDMTMALIQGCDDPAERARGPLRAKRPELEQAPEGRLAVPRRCLLREPMRHLPSRAGLCPRNNRSARKQRSGKGHSIPILRASKKR